MELGSERIYCFSVSQEKDKRIDIFLKEKIQDITRTRVQSLIKEGHVKVNGDVPKISYRVKSGDKILVTIPRAVKYRIEPQEVEFQVLYDDGSIIVLNKPPGLVIHPAPGHMTGTLVHGLLKYCKGLSGVGGELRPGIVHRLDKDTSGILIVAKNDRAHQHLTQQFKEGKVKKRYLAIVEGRIRASKGKVELPLGRDPRKRKKISVLKKGGKKAITLWEKLKDLEYELTYMAISPITGRTHQIRVHMAYIGHPILGDTTYGHSKKKYREVGLDIKRHMLHAEAIKFIHPEKEELIELKAPIPDDMKEILSRVSPEDKRLDNCPLNN